MSDRRAEWDDPTVRTVRVERDRELPPLYALSPAPGEPPVACWAFDALTAHELRIGEHAHDFPVLVYFEQARGTLAVGGRSWPLAPGNVFLVAPGDAVGPFDATTVEVARGWAASFTADALGPDVPGSYLAWRTHPMLFPFVRGGASGALQLSVPPAHRAEWSARLRSLHEELTGRPDGYREAVLAHLVLLLVGVSRLAADVVGDLRVNREPLLAEVFAVIEQRYPGRLSLRDVARAVSVSPGHLTSTVRRRTGRTVQEWITERRMVQARRLLAGTDLPVNEVGRRIGYPDPGYFARVFGREHGVGPTRWRGAATV